MSAPAAKEAKVSIDLTKSDEGKRKSGKKRPRTSKKKASRKSAGGTKKQKYSIATQAKPQEFTLADGPRKLPEAAPAESTEAAQDEGFIYASRNFPEPENKDFLPPADKLVPVSDNQHCRRYKHTDGSEWVLCLTCVHCGIIRWYKYHGGNGTFNRHALVHAIKFPEGYCQFKLTESSKEAKRLAVVNHTIEARLPDDGRLGASTKPKTEKTVG